MQGITYVLIEEHDSSRLIKKINAMLVAGWRLQGGIAFNADSKLYLQAMIIVESDFELIKSVE
jgi:hypothetical protein